LKGQSCPPRLITCMDAAEGSWINRQVVQLGEQSRKDDGNTWERPDIEVKNTFVNVSAPLSESDQGFLAVRNLHRAVRAHDEWQRTACQDDGNSWARPYIDVKNTFVNVSAPLSESVQGFLAVRRQTSDPTSSRSSSQSSCASSSASRDRARNLDTEQDLLGSKDSIRKGGNVGGKSAEVSSSFNERSSKVAILAAASAVHNSGSGTATGSDQAPVDLDGRQSVGSGPHASGKCRPCAFFGLEIGCAVGANCHFCHLEHDGSRKARVRPCKGKRMRCRKLFERLSSEVAANPGSFNAEDTRLPPSISKNAEVKARFLSRLQEVAGEARGGGSSSSHAHVVQTPACSTSAEEDQ